MSDTHFQEHVIAQLNSIANSIDSLSERVVGIEETISDATGFASDMLGDDGSLLGGPSLDSLKDTLSSMISPMMNTETPNATEGADNPESLQDLIASLHEFRGRLSGISETISGVANQSPEVSGENDE